MGSCLCLLVGWSLDFNLQMAEVFVRVFNWSWRSGCNFVRVVSDFGRMIGDGGIFFSLGSFFGVGRWSDHVLISFGSLVIFLLADVIMVLRA